MFVMGVRRKVQLLVMSRVIVAEHQLPGGVHVLVGVNQAVCVELDIHKFAQMKDRIIREVDFSANETFVAASLVVGHVKGTNGWAGVNGFPESLEVDLNPQIGSPARCLPFPAVSLAGDTRRSIRQTPGSLSVHPVRSG
jgi:hypothetical protein